MVCSSWGRRQKVGPVVLRWEMILKSAVLGTPVSQGTHPHKAHGLRWWQSSQIPESFTPPVHLPKWHVGYADSISALAINLQ